MFKPIIVIINLSVHPGTESRFLEYTTQNVKERLVASGCLSVDFYQREDEPYRFVLIEVFETQESIDLYYESSSYLTWHKQVDGLIEKVSGADYIQRN